MNTPWTASTDGEWWDVVGQDGATIARFRGNQHESLARLIAAAPELLEALRYAEAFIAIAVPSTARDREEAINEVLPAIRAAIAKATGNG